MTGSWRHRAKKDEEQVANAKDSFPALTPASQEPAQLVRDRWAAWLPGQTIPLIGERRYEREEE